MVNLLASGSGIPASAARLAHAMHDVLCHLTETKSVTLDMKSVIRAVEANSPGLNDKALAADVAACRVKLTGAGAGPKTTPAERRVKELENTVKQLRASNASLKQKLGETESDLQTALAKIRGLRFPVKPEQAGCRKPDTQCNHTPIRGNDGGTYCNDCGEEL